MKGTYAMANKTKNAPSEPKNTKLKNSGAKVVGILQLFVLVSVTYSTYVVAIGTDGYLPKVMLAPQAIWASIMLVHKFTNR